MSPQMEILLLAVLLVLSAFFSGIETGIVSINRFRLDHLVRRGNAHAVYVRDLLNRPERLFGTVLLGNNIVNTALPVLATAIAVRHFGTWGPWVSGLSTTVCILILGEYLPKAWFQSQPIKRSLPLAGVLRLFATLFHPVTLILGHLARRLTPGADAAARSRPWLTREHLEYVLSPESGATPSLPPAKRQVISGVLSLAGLPCRTLMKPRSRLDPVHDSMALPEILELLRTRPHEHYPVWSEKTRRFIGILDARAVVRGYTRPGFILAECIRPPQFVEETTPANELFRRIRLNRQPMLLITRRGDGEVLGFVTAEVLLEQILAPLYG